MATISVALLYTSIVTYTVLFVGSSGTALNGAVAMKNDSVAGSAVGGMYLSSPGSVPA